MKVPRFALNRARRLIASPQAQMLRAVEQATRKAAANLFGRRLPPSSSPP